MTGPLSIAAAGVDGAGRARGQDPRVLRSRTAVVGATLDRIMFEGERAIPTPEERDALARDGATAFLNAYRR